MRSCSYEQARRVVAGGPYPCSDLLAGIRPLLQKQRQDNKSEYQHITTGACACVSSNLSGVAYSGVGSSACSPSAPATTSSTMLGAICCGHRQTIVLMMYQVLCAQIRRGSDAALASCWRAVQPYASVRTQRLEFGATRKLLHDFIVSG